MMYTHVVTVCGCDLIKYIWLSLDHFLLLPSMDNIYMYMWFCLKIIQYSSMSLCEHYHKNALC